MLQPQSLSLQFFLWSLAIFTALLTKSANNSFDRTADSRPFWFFFLCAMFNLRRSIQSLGI